VDAFCCTGCEIASDLIRGAGLERYYDEREAFAPRPDGLPGGWDTVPVQRGEDGTCTVRLMVDGLRCASCVWVTETLLLRTEGVREARVSYATGRATLRWDPERTDLPHLASTIAALGYRPRLLGEESVPDRDLLLRLGVASFAAANVMLMAAALYAGWFGQMEARFVALFQWVSLALATPVALWAAAPFFAGAWAGLRNGVLHMDLPIALAVAVLYLHGVVVTVGGLGDGYLDSLTMLVALLLAGRMLEGRGRRRAAEAALTLAAVVPATARRIGSGGAVHTVATKELRPGDRITVGAGEELPADGVVAEGSGLVRRALLTGEAAPVPLRAGEQVHAGTVLEDGALVVRVSAVSGDSLVARMARALETAAERATLPTAADRLAPWFTAATLVVAAATLTAWWSIAGGAAALEATIAVLVVACPCALALSHPLAASAGLGAAARRGLLFRSSDALLELADVAAVALDKTGTVTEGEPDVLAASDGALRVAAGLERFSAHPVARAITREAARRGIPLPSATDVREAAGEGISGRVDGRRWRLARGGPGAVDLIADDGTAEPIVIGDRLRTDSWAAVTALEALGLDVVVLTGDHETVALEMARRAGVRTVHARLTPEDKAEWVRARQAVGEPVLFVGDGLNDGPALAAASVGVAMGTGSASSILAADGVLAAGSVAPLAAGVRAARAARRAIRGNMARSLVYNVTAVGAAAAGLVNPLVAAVLMPLSSAMVLWGASRVEAAVRVGERVPDAAPGSGVAPAAVAGSTAEVEYAA
jgi:P-type Cu2+ transporter